MRHWIILLSVTALLLAACGQASNEGAPSSTVPPTTSPPTSSVPTTEPPASSDTAVVPQGLQPLVDAARADLAQRLDIADREIEVLRVEFITWPDGAVGCPQPGMSYIQILIDGAIIELQVGSTVYPYHSGGDQSPFLCEQ